MEVNIYHPSLEETEATNETKESFSKSGTGDSELDSNADGSSNSLEEINTFLLNHEYENYPAISKVKSGRKIRGSKENENTKKCILEDDKLRTTAEVGER